MFRFFIKVNQESHVYLTQLVSIVGHSICKIAEISSHGEISALSQLFAIILEIANLMF